MAGPIRCNGAAPPSSTLQRVARDLATASRAVASGVPSPNRVRPIYLDLASTSTFLHRVLVALLEPDGPQPRQASERVLAYLARRHISSMFPPMVSCVFRLPALRTDMDRVGMVAAVVRELDSDGRPSVDKIAIGLAFAAVYICYVVQDQHTSAAVLSHQLAGLYLCERLQWMVATGGLSAAVRKCYPKLWLLTALRMRLRCDSV